MEANEAKRKAYKAVVKEISDSDIIYVDESGIDSGVCKEKGWGERGKALNGKRSGKSYQRLNVIAGLNQGRSIAPFYFYGSCNTEVFHTWVEEVLIPELKPGQVIILDNATFHKSPKTKRLIEAVGCRLIFLPPYSPDLNPIEKFWAKMKKWIRNRWRNMEKIAEAIQLFFRSIST